MLGLPCHSTVEYKQLIENKSVLSKKDYFFSLCDGDLITQLLPEK